jgi:hypothetical protein
MVPRKGDCAFSCGLEYSKWGNSMFGVCSVEDLFRAGHPKPRFGSKCDCLPAISATDAAAGAAFSPAGDEGWSSEARGKAGRDAWGHRSADTARRHAASNGRHESGSGTCGFRRRAIRMKHFGSTVNVQRQIADLSEPAPPQFDDSETVSPEEAIFRRLDGRKRGLKTWR